MFIKNNIVINSSSKDSGDLFGIHFFYSSNSLTCPWCQQQTIWTFSCARFLPDLTQSVPPFSPLLSPWSVRGPEGRGGAAGRPGGEEAEHRPQVRPADVQRSSLQRRRLLPRRRAQPGGAGVAAPALRGQRGQIKEAAQSFVVHHHAVNPNISAVPPQIALETGLSVDEVKEDARSILEEMSQNLQLSFIRLMGYVLAKVFKRLFSGVFVNVEGLNTVRAANTRYWFRRRSLLSVPPWDT